MEEIKQVLRQYREMLERRSTEPCACRPDRDSVCLSCQAKIRLAQQYEPSVKQIIHEEGALP